MSRKNGSFLCIKQIIPYNTYVVVDFTTYMMYNIVVYNIYVVIRRIE